MKKTEAFRAFAFFATGILAALLALNLRHFVAPTSVAMAQEPGKGAGVDLTALQADVNHLKDIVPSQSHTMTDVGYQFANLWFAEKAKNWSLAEFFLNESRSHILWTIRIRPVRKTAAGGSIDIGSVFDGMKDGALRDLDESVTSKNDEDFVVAYKKMLEGCYGCHVAAGLPYLRPIVPQAPPQTIIDFSPEPK